MLCPFWGSRVTRRGDQVAYAACWQLVLGRGSGRG
jgi:hypothetical protein